MAASTASHRPIKGILKNKTSTTSSVVASAEQPRRTVEEELSKKSQKWDEVNILAIYHPANKDYGLMKIGKPNTLYRNTVADYDDSDNDSEVNEIMNPDFLTKKLAVDEASEPTNVVLEQESSGEKDDEELEKKQQFDMKRKLHYNERLNIKLARLLISKQLQDDDKDGMSMTTNRDSINIEESNQGSTERDHLQQESQSS